MAAGPGCPCYIWEMCLGHPCLSMAEPLGPRLGRGCRPQTVSPQPRLTSKRCELTFLPFLFQVTRGLGSPVA